MSDTALFTEIEQPEKRAWLIAFTRCGSLKEAAENAAVGRTTAWMWRRDDAQFSEAYKVASQIYSSNYINELELELKKRSLDKDQPMSTVALFFALKAENREKYGDRAIEHRFTGDIIVRTMIPRPEYPELDKPKELPIGTEDDSRNEKSGV